MVDEASGVREDIFEAIEGCMTSSRARLLLIGNPTSRSGTFYDAFHSQRGLWHTIHISAFDTPNLVEQEIHFPGLVTPQWVNEAAKIWGDKSPVYQIRVLGDFPSQGADNLIPLPAIEAAVESSRAFPLSEHPRAPVPTRVGANGNTPAPNPNGTPDNGPTDGESLPSPRGGEGVGETVVGVDVARFGTDRTVLPCRSHVAQPKPEQLCRCDHLQVCELCPLPPRRRSYSTA